MLRRQYSFSCPILHTGTSPPVTHWKGLIEKQPFLTVVISSWLTGSENSVESPLFKLQVLSVIRDWTTTKRVFVIKMSTQSRFCSNLNSTLNPVQHRYPTSVTRDFKHCYQQLKKLPDITESFFTVVSTVSFDFTVHAMINTCRVQHIINRSINESIRVWLCVLQLQV